jgi:hypothetical protein
MKDAPINKVYEFAFKGMLTEEALDRVGRKTKKSVGLSDEKIAQTLSIDLMDDDIVHSAKQMAIVYTATASFENSVRELISGVLAETKGEKWWSEVAKGIRESAEKRMEEEQKTKWHTQRDQNPINYTTLGNLLAIMRHNWVEFEPYIQDIDWATAIFDAIERSRNVIMHSGSLEKADIERLGIYIRDWIKQVGT